MSFAEFFARARTEAARYGPDPWIFVRELLQNARDAGATRVHIDVELEPELTRVVCTDDGEGMSFEHAKRYLFSLYSSSKEEDESSVGKFGVGFWSILRFEPDRIEIRSRTRGHPAWEIELRADSPSARQRHPAWAGGTRILLERQGRDPEAVRRLEDTVRQSARFLRRRDDGSPLDIFVQGKRLNAPFALPAPMAAFRTRHGRGVVSLGSAPRVELFANGLRVRAASCLEDLADDERTTSRSRVRFPTVDGVLAPQVILEANHIEPLLSRSEVRDDPHLRRLIERAQAQLRRLVRRQLDTLRPPGLGERAREAFRAISEAPVWAQITGAGLFGATLAIAAAPFVWGALRPPPAPVTPIAVTTPASGGLASYRDISLDYHGPEVSELDPARAQRLDLRYAPADERLFFGLLTIDDFRAQASREAGVTDDAYVGVRCGPQDDCLDVWVHIDSPPGAARIPLPTGHRLDPERMELDGRPLAPRLQRSEADEAVLIAPEGLRGELHYRSRPGPGPGAGAEAARTALARPAEGTLPPELAAWVPELQAIPSIDARVAEAMRRVKTRVRYAVDQETSIAHREARAAGQGFLERALEIGAGDCDVQNGTLAAVLRPTGIDARLVVGVVGAKGRARPWLHAWLEYPDDGGRWRVADASEGQSLPTLPPRPSRDALDPAPDPTTTTQGRPTVAPPVAAPSVTGEAHTATPAAAPTKVARWTSGLRTTLALLPPQVPLAMAGLSAILACLMLLTLWRRRLGRVAVDRGVELADMLQGALRQPQAFRQLPELFHRRLVPTRRGPAISLSEARRLGAAGRLYAARGDSALATDAARTRATVIDLRAAEGEAVARTLGAVDLDHFGELERHLESDPILERLAGRLRDCGARWRLGRVSGMDRGLRSLDLHALGLAATRGIDRIVFLDADDPVLAAARDTATRAPEAATFGLLDDLLARLDLEPLRRSELLASSARAALLERASTLREAPGD